jgi:hypothetical protein
VTGTSDCCLPPIQREAHNNITYLMRIIDLNEADSEHLEQVATLLMDRFT